MVSHAEDHERAKRLLGIIIELNDNDDDYVPRKNESKEAFRRRVNDMTNRAESATLQLHEIGFDTELRDGRYRLVRYQPPEDEGDEDDGKPFARKDDEEGSAHPRSEGRDNNCKTRIVISDGIIVEGDLHVSGMHPNNEADINLLLSYGQDPCETVEVAQAVSRLHASGYVVELRARAIAAAAKPNVVAAARSNAGMAAAAMSTDDVVNLVDSDDDFDVTMVGEELKKNKTYKTALVILQGRKYGSPTHDTQLKLLFGFKEKAAVPFFWKDSSQAKEFNAIQQQLLSNAKKTASTIKKEYTFLPSFWC